MINIVKYDWNHLCNDVRMTADHVGAANYKKMKVHLLFEFSF